ncbi:MAG TPA: hypothetical protein VMA53_10490 [Stellaceae bacterium]|nr:hypothetical protein [Stellaceae bacterium]
MAIKVLSAAHRVDGFLRHHLGRFYHVILAAGCVIALIHGSPERHASGGILHLGFAVVLNVVLAANQASAVYGYFESRRQSDEAWWRKMVIQVLSAAHRLDGVLQQYMGRFYHVILAAGCVIELIHRVHERRSFLNASGSVVPQGLAVVLYVVLVVNQASALHEYFERRRQRNAAGA